LRIEEGFAIVRLPLKGGEESEAASKKAARTVNRPKSGQVIRLVPAQQNADAEKKKRSERAKELTVSEKYFIISFLCC
jgi:hypothetical protein